MATDPLADAGFYFDDLNKLRVLGPDVSQKTSELKEECKEFVDSKHRSIVLNCPPNSSRYYKYGHVILHRNRTVSEDSGWFD